MTNEWTKVKAGHYRHDETGIEIVKVPAHREHGYAVGVRWTIIVPRHGYPLFSVYSGSTRTLKDAMKWANSMVERMRIDIAVAWDQAHKHEILMREARDTRHANVPGQVVAWWVRHGLDQLWIITVEAALAARDADHVEALAEDSWRADPAWRAVSQA